MYWMHFALTHSLTHTYHLPFITILSFIHHNTFIHSNSPSFRSERQARLEKEQADMMEKINKIRKTDFDNTKRIERPEEILERRKTERERRNVWYKRAWRALTFQN
jgi:uncharacterized protein (UPF0305 family)